jgi:pteridine reductase
MNKTVLITGAAKRVGAEIAKELHCRGMNIVIHFYHSHQEAEQLVLGFNAVRPHSAYIVQGDISNIESCQKIVKKAHGIWQRLDLLINNASRFYPTPIGNTTITEWDDLLDSNLKGAFFLSQAAAPFLKATFGTIINLADINADRPLKGYSVYSIAKAGVVMLTKALAIDLGPEVRVNAVAPGVILWPEDINLSDTTKQHIIDKTILKRKGNLEDIARAVSFLAEQDFITGQIIAVDGGQSIK